MSPINAIKSRYRSFLWEDAAACTLFDDLMIAAEELQRECRAQAQRIADLEREIAELRARVGT